MLARENSRNNHLSVEVSNSQMTSWFSQKYVQISKIHMNLKQPIGVYSSHSLYGGNLKISKE